MSIDQALSGSGAGGCAVAEPGRDEAALSRPPASWSNVLGCRRFRAMNTDVRLFLRDYQQAGALASAERIFHEVEERCSRFRTDSELSILNACAGHAVAASAELFDVLAHAQRYGRLTDGIFEPAVLPALEAAGYGRSFDLIAGRNLTLAASAPARHSIAELRLDRRRQAVRAPAGLRLDLGGIGKGYAVDTAAAHLRPLRDYLVDAGGDIFAAGNGPDGDGWLVGVASPFEMAPDLGVVRLHDEALATSTTAVRRWRRNGRWQHHLIDPRTGAPVENDVLSVSVCARCAMDADVFAKAALILGRDDGARFLEAHGAAALFVMVDGGTYASARWRMGAAAA
ncbi:MAG: FAD:protein FMN transferase [Chloroflexota bacterium]|nr:FAD:protein FMN transferase [Chloroflexota bacterium]